MDQQRRQPQPSFVPAQAVAVAAPQARPMKAAPCVMRGELGAVQAVQGMLCWLEMAARQLETALRYAAQRAGCTFWGMHLIGVLQPLPATVMEIHATIQDPQTPADIVRGWAAFCSYSHAEQRAIGGSLI